MQLLHEPICHVCRELVTYWADAQRTLFATESRLTSAEDASTSEFQKRRIATQEARLECDLARLEFESHRRTHPFIEHAVDQVFAFRETPAVTALQLNPNPVLSNNGSLLKGVS
jgi:hypothetical protein